VARQVALVREAHLCGDLCDGQRRAQQPLGAPCLVELQAGSGGDALIGRRLHPLLVDAGFRSVVASPRIAYADGSRPEWVEGFTRNTFVAMVEGVRDEVIRRRLMSPEDWQAGIDGLRRTTEPDGVFCYTFFKAVGAKEETALPSRRAEGS
jgi:hypothetical protein